MKNPFGFLPLKTSRTLSVFWPCHPFVTTLGPNGRELKFLCKQSFWYQPSVLNSRKEGRGRQSRVRERVSSKSPPFIKAFVEINFHFHLLDQTGNEEGWVTQSLLAYRHRKKVSVTVIRRGGMPVFQAAVSATCYKFNLAVVSKLGKRLLIHPSIYPSQFWILKVEL